MSISAETKLIRNKQIVFSEIDGETVMMDEKFEQYFGMEEVGTRIWTLLDSEQSIEELCLKLTTEYEVNKADCLKDIRPFLEYLIKQNMVYIR